MFAWWCGPWLVKVGARASDANFTPGRYRGTISTLDVYVRFCYVQLSEAGPSLPWDCRIICDRSLYGDGIWSSQRQLNWLQTSLEDCQILTVPQSLNSKWAMMWRGWGVASLCHAFSATLTTFLRLRQQMMYIPRRTIASVSSSCRCHIRAVVKLSS